MDLSVTSKWITGSSILLLAACVTVPTGPSIMALPGSGKSFEQFRSDDASCRQFAIDQSGGANVSQTAADSGVRSAIVGTLIGAAAGAALGGQQGAGVGAGAGLLVGSAAGVGAADASAQGAQQRYDNAYVQCMYAQGNQVPVDGSFRAPQRRYPPRPGISSPPLPPPPDYPPPGPPPQGYYPPPPG